MFRLSRKTLFALEAVLDIAYNSRAEPVQSKDITHRQGIPRRYLEQVMQQLVRAGVLKGVRGPRGGYHLARERRRITVGEIVRVVGAMEDAEDDSVYESQSALGQQVVAPLLQDLRQTLMERLDALTIQDLCQRANQANVRAENSKHVDFTI